MLLINGLYFDPVVGHALNLNLDEGVCVVSLFLCNINTPSCMQPKKK